MFEASLRYNNFNNNHPIETVPNNYDSLVVEGHLLSHAKKAAPPRLKQLAEDHGTVYYIDPALSDFHHQDNFVGDNGIKGWHQKYLSDLGDPVQSLVEDETELEPANLSTDTIIELARQEVQFQETIVPESLEKHSGKYEEFDPDQYAPEAIVPWYYQIESKADIQINRDILRASLDEASQSVKPCLHVGKPFLHRDGHIDSLVDVVDLEGISQCFLWVDDMGKHNTSESDYYRITKLVDELSNAGIEPHFLYGDYFATISAHFGAGGTTYGTMYAEDAKERTDTPSGGGGMLNRYYTDPVKDFLKIPATVDVMRRADADICDCEVCQRHLDDWSDLLDMDDDDDQNMQAFLGKHHLLIRWKQIRKVESESLDETLDRLRGDYDEFIQHYSRSPQVSPKKTLDYIQRWRNAVNRYSE